MVGNSKRRVLIVVLALLRAVFGQGKKSCEWGPDEHVRRFVRIPEDAPVGSVVFDVDVSSPELLQIHPVKDDLSGRISSLPFTEEYGEVVVAAPLSPLVSRNEHSSVLKFALFCGTNPVFQQVTVYIEDINNHWPIFLEKNITITVDELLPTGLVVLQEILVHDADKPNTANSEIELSLEREVSFTPKPNSDEFATQRSASPETTFQTERFGQNAIDENPSLVYREEKSDYFTLTDVKKGEIKLIKSLDFDEGPRRFELTIVAKDMGKSSLSSSATIHVLVKDSDDLNPKFTSKKYTASILEYPGPDIGAEIRDRIITDPESISAFDGDLGINAALRYNVIDGEFSPYFSIDEDTGELFLIRHLDREKLIENTLTIHLLAVQVDNPSREASAEVSISVGDVNDHLPLFENDIYSISIVENLPIGFSVVQVSAFDMDEDENAQFTYFIDAEDTPLAVNSETGWLTVSNQTILDREVTNMIELKVCTRQAKPIVYLSPEILAEVRENDLEGKETGNTFRKHDGVTQFNTHILPNSVKPFGWQDTPDSMRVQSISPSVRSLFPRALIEKGKYYLLLNKKQSIPRARIIERPFLSRKESSLERLLSTRRILSRAKEALQNKTEDKPIDHNKVNSFNQLPKRITRGTKAKNVNDNGHHLLPLTEFLRFNNSIESPCALIRLTLLDANDNNPVFIPSNHYQFIVLDSINVGAVVGSVKATDADNGINGIVKYRIQKPSQDGSNQNFLFENFDLNSETGVLRVKSSVTVGQATLFVEASDSPSNPSETRTTLAIVTITIKPQNNLRPQFIGAPYEFWVGGDAPIGTSVGQVKVTNVGNRKPVFDMFHSYDEMVPFGIEETSGIVAVTKQLRDFSRPRYDLEGFVSASETEPRYFELVTNVTIYLAPPSRSETPEDIVVTFTVPENLSGGKVGDLVKSLRDLGVHLDRYPQLTLVSPESKPYFSLSDEGILYTVTPLDYEVRMNHTLVIVNSRTSLIFYVLVKVEDLNDNAPQFNAVHYEGFIHENASQGTAVKITPGVKVTDLDSYEGASSTVYLLEEDKLFGFREDSGQVVFLGGQLDREKQQSYSLVLKVVDDGNLTSFANLTITIEDINDNTPQFTQRIDVIERMYREKWPTPRQLNIPVQVWNLTQKKDSILSIPETLPVGSTISQVLAEDRDTGTFGKVEYDIAMQSMFYLSSENSVPSLPVNKLDFGIEPTTGSILVAEKLLPNTFYILNVTATDGGGLSSVVNIPISVFDVNNNAPVFDEPSYAFKIFEGEYVVSDVGKVAAEDEDSGENGEISYHIILPLNATVADVPFRILETTGRILISGTVDREIQEKFVFFVKAEDRGTPPQSSKVQVEVLIQDVNDHSPEFLNYHEYFPLTEDSETTIPLYRAVVSETAPPGSIITKVSAQDLDNSATGNGLIFYKLQDSSPSLAIDSQDGTIYTTERLDYESEPLLQAKVIAQDMAKPPHSATSLLTVVVEDVVNELTARTFPQEVYEVHTFENSKVPERLARIQLDPEVTGDKTFHLRLVDSTMLSTIHLDPLSGDLLLIRSLDREAKSHYRFKIRAVEVHKGRSLNQMGFFKYRNQQNISDDITSFLFVDPITTDSIANTTETANLFDKESYDTSELIDTAVTSDYEYSSNSSILESLKKAELVKALALDEAWIYLIVNDLNDNPPEFLSAIPIIAAISSNAMFGDRVATVTAIDGDEGINSEIRYEIVPTISFQPTLYFGLDAITGELTVTGELLDIVGEMVRFDIRAKDKRGEEGGKSSTTSVSIHVLGEASQLVIELNAPASQIYPHIGILQSALTNISEYEIMIQKITPHVGRDMATIEKTDVFIFGIDPGTKELIPPKMLKASLRHQQHIISSILPGEISLAGIRATLSISTKKYLKSAELAILVGALVVFLACISSIVCLCYRQRKSRRKPRPLPPEVNINMAPSTVVPILPRPYNGQYPGPYAPMSEQSDSSESTTVVVTDSVHGQQMAERKPRQAFRRAYSRTPEALHRKNRSSGTQLTHIDNDNWQCRARQQCSNSNEPEEETCRQTHRCNHNFPNAKRSSVNDGRWHIGECSPGRDGALENARTAHLQNNRGSSRQNRNPRCGEGFQENDSPKCAAGARPAPSDSLERNQSRTVHREVPAVVRAINHRKTNGRLSDDVTEL